MFHKHTSCIFCNYQDFLFQVPTVQTEAARVPAPAVVDREYVRSPIRRVAVTTTGRGTAAIYQTALGIPTVIMSVSRGNMYALNCNNAVCHTANKIVGISKVV